MILFIMEISQVITHTRIIDKGQTIKSNQQY